MHMNDDNFPKINSEQADNIVELVRDMFGENTVNMIDNHGININHLVRSMYLSKLCIRKREEKGISLKKASSNLKIPQYKLKYIETTGIVDIELDILEKYIQYLGIEKEFYEWQKQNQDIYKEMGKKKR
jgi:hypothetical protein